MFKPYTRHDVERLYLKDKKYDEALKLGSACGGATAFSEDLAEASMIQEVYKQLQVVEL